MEKNKKNSIIDSALHLLRRMLICTVIVAVAALAIFWESLPDSIKKTVTSFSTTRSDKNNDDLIPYKFRVENHSINSENILSQPIQLTQFADLPDETMDRQTFPRVNTEYSVTMSNQNGLDDATLAQLYDELKQFGATACQLTYWGNQRNMFRFSCQVPVHEYNPIAVRTFQSIAPDANQSIQEVIEQVRQSRNPPR